MSETYSQLYKRLIEDEALLEIEVAKAAALSPSNLMQAAYAQSSLYMTWCYMSSLANADMEKAKYNLNEVILPKLRGQCRELATSHVEVDEDGKRSRRKITIQETNDWAQKQPEYLAAAEKLRTAEKYADIFRKVEFVLSAKKDMIQSINSRQRREEAMANIRMDDD